jgi:hypothetical protein
VQRQQRDIRYDMTGFTRRLYDGVLGQMDLVFVKADGDVSQDCKMVKIVGLPKFR